MEKLRLSALSLSQHVSCNVPGEAGEADEESLPRLQTRS